MSQRNKRRGHSCFYLLKNPAIDNQLVSSGKNFKFDIKTQLDLPPADNTVFPVGAKIHWEVVEGDGRLQSSSTFVGMDGIAEVFYNVGDSEIHIIKASVKDKHGNDFGNTVEYTITVDAALSLAIVSGNDQTGNVGTALQNLPTVQVIDSFNNPVPNVQVDFAVTAGGGRISTNSVLTDNSGLAQTIWILGPTPGINTLTASAKDHQGNDIAGSPVTFNAESGKASFILLDMTATAINDSGQVVGWSRPPWPERRHALLWKNGVMTDLGTLGGTESWASGINNSGQVVGTALIRYALRCFLWENGVMTDILPADVGSASAHAINNSGQVVGSGSPVFGAFLLENGNLTVLGTLGIFGILKSDATAINNSGQVVGYQEIITGAGITREARAFLWENGNLDTLGTLESGGASYASGINNSGQVIGRSGGRAFLWENGVMTDLGTLGSGNLVWASGINNSGQVVGRSGIYPYERAFLWENGVMTDLNTFVPSGASVTLSWARAINDSGQVVGFTSRGSFLLKLPDRE